VAYSALVSPRHGTARASSRRLLKPSATHTADFDRVFTVPSTGYCAAKKLAPIFHVFLNFAHLLPFLPSVFFGIFPERSLFACALCM
jgi:hypothetical protein